MQNIIRNLAFLTPIFVLTIATPGRSASIGAITSETLEFPVLNSVLNSEVNSGIYSLDDGTAEASIGFNGGGDIAWLNSFTVVEGHKTITDILIAWGSSIDEGEAASVHLWSDPNNDGNPDDAVLLESVNTTVTNPSTNTFASIDIPDRTFAVGDTFFVGGFMSSTDTFFPALLDQTSSAGKSWVSGGAVGSVDLNNLSGSSAFGTIDSFGIPGNLLVRAKGTPEPENIFGTIIALTIAMMSLRKKR